MSTSRLSDSTDSSPDSKRVKMNNGYYTTPPATLAGVGTGELQLHPPGGGRDEALGVINGFTDPAIESSEQFQQLVLLCKKFGLPDP